MLTLASIVACRGESTDDDEVGEAEAGTGTDATETNSTGDSTGEGGEGPFDYCEGAPPDADCYAAKRDPSSESVALAMAIADRHIETHPPTEQVWDWIPTVFMFSLTELHRVTGEARYQDHYAAWMNHHIDNGYSMVNSDKCAPAAIAAALYAETGDPAYLAVLNSAHTYLDEIALRDEDGALNHQGNIGVWGVTLWVDSLFMLGNVMTRWGELEDDVALLDDIGLQFTLFSGHLQDPSGLFAHAHMWDGVDPTIFWARGNGWVAASGPDYLRARLIRGESDPVVEEVMRAQMQGIVATQDASGAWWSLMNRPDEIYLETSGTALLGYGLARGFRYGFYDADVLPVIEQAVAGVEATIVEDDLGPIVTGISGPTGPGGFDDYAMVELQDDLDYGAGAVILLLIESSGLPPSE